MSSPVAALGGNVTLPLAMFDAVQSQSVGTSMYRHAHAALSCRVVLTASAVMLGGLFLIELRYALWASPPNITAFVFPALSCQSVHAALLRPAQVLGSYIASASQVLVSALGRRDGLDSLAHRAGAAIASSVTMPPPASRAFVAARRIVTFASSTAGRVNQWQRLGTALAKLHGNHSQLLRKDGSTSAVALGVGLASLAHRAGIPVRPPLVFSRYGHRLRRPSGLHKAAFCESARQSLR